MSNQEKGGENMKKIMSIMLVVLFCFLMIAPASALENGATPRYNNTVSIYPYFYISSEGEAELQLQYRGYEGVTTGATITSKIQKKTLWWWKDVDGASWTDEATGHYNTVVHYFNLSKSGTYRLVYEFQIRGTGGAADVISGNVEDKF